MPKKQIVKKYDKDIKEFRKEKRAATRNSKIRLSSLKIGELTQVMRGKSKIIK